MVAQKFLRSFAFGCIFVTGLSLAIPSSSIAQKYRVILPPRPQQPPALNNTVQAQIANQNVGFNTQNQVNGFGGGGFGQGGGFQANSGGLQGTGQVTQNNAPGSQLSFLYQLPTATQFQPGGGFGQGGGGGGFGQGGGGQFGGGQFGGGGQGGGGQAIDPNIDKNNAALQKQIDLKNALKKIK